MKKHKLINDVLHSWLVIILAALIVCGTTAVISLRSNYTTMVRLREAVNTADQNNGDVEAALQDLRRQVYGHMNTNLSSGPNPIKPPIQLKARYDRLMKVEQQRVKQINLNVTANGEAVCARLYPASGYNDTRVTCIQRYVSAHASKENPVPEDLYKFDFVSPRWSPDLAGFSLAATALLGLIFLGGLGYKIKQRRK